MDFEINIQSEIIWSYIILIYVIYLTVWFIRTQALAHATFFDMTWELPIQLLLLNNVRCVAVSVGNVIVTCIMYIIICKRLIRCYLQSRICVGYCYIVENTITLQMYDHHIHLIVISNVIIIIVGCEYWFIS